VRLGVRVGPVYASERVRGGPGCLWAFLAVLVIGAAVAAPLVFWPVLGGLVALVIVVKVKRRRARKAEEEP
jgi:hypothetical protein